jgi:hypothetical protein
VKACAAFNNQKTMNTKTEKTYWVRIYLSGSMATIEQTCRKDSLKEGLCITVEPTKFIYTGGEESGAVVGLINYPRFPTTPDTIWARSVNLALRLLNATYQHSVLVMSPEITEWITKREISPNNP